MLSEKHDLPKEIQQGNNMIVAKISGAPALGLIFFFPYNKILL